MERTGAELGRVLKAIRPTLPVLIVSGYTEHNRLDPDRLGRRLLESRA